MAILGEEENIKKNLDLLEALKKKGVTFDLKVCPQCKSSNIFLMDVLGAYAPLSPARHICKKCGWVGHGFIEMTNRRIDELDEEILEDIIHLLSEENEEKY